MTALVLINTGPNLGAYIAPPMAIGPAQWPDVSDEQLRQYTSPAFSRPGYRIPRELLNEMRAMTFHSLTTTLQASRDYVKEQALPGLGPTRILEDPARTASCLLAFTATQRR